MSKQGGLRKKMNRIMMMVKEYENGEYREDILLSFPSHSTPEPTGQLSAESVQAEDTPNKIDFRFVMTILAFSMAFVGSQLLPLLFATLTYGIAADLNAGTKTTWLFSAQLVACGAIAPFVGSFSDIYGKKLAALIGVASSLLGMIICASAQTAETFIAGQAFGGMSIAIQELTAIAAISELVPVAKRGFYGAILISGFAPFTPSSLYGQMIAETSWRYNAALLAIWNILTFLMLAIFYQNPHKRDTTVSKTDAFHRMDVIGGIFSIAGICIFLIGLNWGGEAYSWSSHQVVSTLTIGLAFCVAFGVWEKWGTRHPLFPASMIRAPRAFWMIMLVTLTAGIVYVSVLLFWPIQATAVYGANRFHLGVYTLPYGLCILSGAIISALLLSVFTKHVQYVMAAFCIMQTVGTACMSTVDPRDIRTVWGPLVVGLIGAGGVLVPNQIIITAITSDEFISTATALALSVRLIGQVIGYSLFYNRLTNTVFAKSFDIMLPVALKTGIVNQDLITSFVTNVTSQPWSEFAKSVPQLDTQEKRDAFGAALVDLWGESFPIIYHISIAFGVIACVACVLVGDVRRFMSQHVAAHF